MEGSATSSSAACNERMCLHGKESAPVTCWLTRFEKGGHEPPVPHRIADFRLEDGPYVPWLHYIVKLLLLTCATLWQMMPSFQISSKTVGVARANRGSISFHSFDGTLNDATILSRILCLAHPSPEPTSMTVPDPFWLSQTCNRTTTLPFWCYGWRTVAP